MHAWMILGVWANRQMNERMDGWMDGWVDGWMDGLGLPEEHTLPLEPAPALKPHQLHQHHRQRWPPLLLRGRPCARKVATAHGCSPCWRETHQSSSGCWCRVLLALLLFGAELGSAAKELGLRAPEPGFAAEEPGLSVEGYSLAVGGPEGQQRRRVFHPKSLAQCLVPQPTQHLTQASKKRRTRGAA